MPVDNLIGQTFGRLKVIRAHHGKKWECQCSCGKETIVFGSNLKRSHTQSCGCLHRERTSKSHKTHGLSKTPEYIRKKDRKNGATYRERQIKKDPFYGRRHHLKYRFGITLEAYNLILESQMGVCAVCSAAPGDDRLHWFCVDHDHDTGAVRGIICHKCNVGLGMFSDDPKLVTKAAKYLKARVL